MHQPASIFNDVIGPIMIGPSSSHTAASIRIGQVIRSMLKGQVKKVIFEFSASGSLAATYQGQGAALGLAAGIMGFSLDDSRMTEALKIAKSTGVEIQFAIKDVHWDHPNTYKITMWDDEGGCLSSEMVSVGGGMIEVRKIEDIPVLLRGGYYETIFLFGEFINSSCREEQVYNNALVFMKSSGLSYDEVSLHHNQKGDYLLNIKSPVDLGEKVDSLISFGKQLNIKPVLPILSKKDYPGLFNTAQKMLVIAEKEGLSPWELAVKYESLRGGISKEEVLDKMTQIVRIIQSTMDAAEKDENDYPDRILDRQAYKLQSAKLLAGITMNEVIKRITLMMEGKSSMKVIVAAPTAGSCGVVPGTLFGVASVLKVGEEELVQGMMVAGLIGIIIAEHATFAGEVGGCQAECGSASGMAAAGVVQLMGGTVEQALDAASMALQNVLGMVCDPVADRVEVPCFGKNIMCGLNALGMANLAMAGFDPVIPLDETIRAMALVGEMIPIELRCTGKAGLSTTNTSAEIWHKLNDED